MRVPLSWLTTLVELPVVDSRDIADRLTRAGLKVEHVEEVGADIAGVVVARVLDVEELTQYKKPIRWVTLTDGSDQHQVICGATNFAVGDLVAYARPPAMLPGGFHIEKRSAYGHESDGMICSARELGLGDDHTGILVLGSGDDVTSPPGADVVETMGLRDTVIELGINPDRGYALSMRGVAREVATAYGVDYRDPADVDVPAADGTGHRVRLEDAAGCDRYVARIVTGLDPSAVSPPWLQRRLALAGMRPISLAVDVTNHVMLELGQPLHAFDRDKLSGDIVVRRAAARERLKTLDDVERTLDSQDLVIADDSGPIAIAGVMGGAATEIDPATSDIVLEAAHFDQTSVAYTARRHRLGSEASRRFERGVDHDLAPAAAQAAVDLLVTLGGAAAAGSTDVDKRVPRPPITFDPAMPGRIAGLTYSKERVRARLHDIGCSTSDAQPLEVAPPSWRPDLRLPVDLVEEVLRLEGYENLPSTVPAAPAGRGLRRVQRQRRQVGRALADAGFAEIVSFPFTAVSSAEALLLLEDDERRPAVRVANPISDEEPYLRATLLPGLLTALARNVGRGFPDTALFESGLVFRPAPDPAAMPRPPAGERPPAAVLEAMESALPVQPWHVAVAMAGHWERPGWWGSGRPATWADAVQAGRILAAAVGTAVEVRAADRPPWHPGRCAALVVGERVVGHAGELHPRVVEMFDLPPRVNAMELDLQLVLDAVPDVLPAPEVSAYPPATLDVALVVADDVPAADVAAALRDGAGPLLEDLSLFDVYAGAQVGPGRRSLAFTLRLRAPDRTLTVEESVAVRDAAVATARDRCGAELRA